MKVPPGYYSVRIDPAELDKRGMGAKTLSDMDIIPDGNVLSGQDIHLVALAKEDILATKKEAPKVLFGKTEQNMAPFNDYDLKELENIVDEMLKRGQKIKGPEFKTEVDKLDIYKDGEWLYPGKKKVDALPKEKFGIHLTSYRTPEKAIAGIKYLMDKYKNILGSSDFTVKKINISKEKGDWYRVFAGSFHKKENAEKLKKQIKMSLPYCKVISLDTGADNKVKKGVHLTSFKTTTKAILSIKELKNQYPSLLKDAVFSIKNVDLGPEKGKWKRVVAGNFSDESDAKMLAKRIKMRSPFSTTIKIEQDDEFGIHLASFKTCEKASTGLKTLQKKYRSILNNEEFSIRRVSLGDEKGIWYRVFSGRFKDKDSAISIKNSLNKMNQYAQIVNL